RRIAFVALDRLHVMDWPSGTPRRVTTQNVGEYQPVWSPDGTSLVYTTWSNSTGGALMRVPAAGGTPQRLTTEAGFWQTPAFSLDGRRIVAIRGPMRNYRESISAGAGGAAQEIVWIPSTGGAATVIAPTGGL